MYRYSPLAPSKNQIRVRRPLTGSRGNKTVESTPEVSSLSFEIEMVSLNDKPSYAALSYVWGKKTDEERSILIDNTKAIIRPSLYEALQHLQYEDIKPAIWIDAICINQMDVEEKNDQVPRMRAIYSGVRQAIIWLGPETKETKEIGLFVDTFTKEYRKKFELPEDPKYPLIDYAEFNDASAILA